MKSGRFGILFIGALVLLAALLAIVGPKLVEKTPEKLPSVTDKGQQAGITAKGVVESADDVELSSQVKGTIARVMIEEGAEVKKGQLLLEFDQTKVEAQRRQARSALTAAEARYREATTGYRSEDIAMVTSASERSKAIYDQARDEYERQRRLFEKGATAQVELNRAEERMRVAEGDLSGAKANLAKHRHGVRNEERDQARADVERARADLQYVEGVMKDYRIHAPIDGIVIDKHKKRGEGCDFGTPLLRIVNVKSLRIRAELEETDLGKVREGQQVEVTVDAFRDRVFRGRVDKTFPTVQKKTQKSFDPTAIFDINTQKIHIDLDDYKGLKNGMTVTVRFR